MRCEKININREEIKEMMRKLGERKGIKPDRLSGYLEGL